MGIQHIEDLALPDFIKAVKNISTMHALEKLDGANLWLGVDEDGRLWTSREGKREGAKRFYSKNEYPRFAAYNGFRGAHAALQEKEVDIKRIMQPGQTVEMEILYSRQPNAITYGLDGKSYIAFLRGVNGTPDVVADQLSMTLGGTSVKVTVDIVDTTDGESLDVYPQEITWQFTGAQVIPADKLKNVDLDKHLKKLEAYLEQPAEVEGLNLTNYDLIVNSLGSIPADLRAEAKLKKNEVLAKVTTDFKLPIKKELLDNYVSKIKPALQHLDVTVDEDVGIEGVVLRDPTTGDLIKLVDKDNFTTINAFNHAIRNQISGVTKTLDGSAPLEARGGILGDMKIKIADLLGNKELARGGTAKRAFATVKGSTPVETVKNFTKNLAIADFLGMKRKLLAIIQQAAIDLKQLLEDFKTNKDEFQLKLKNGRTIGISPEIEKRTLLVFAESRRNIFELHEKIKKAKTTAQVIAVLYGHLAKDIHEVQPEEVETKVQEELILEKKSETDKAQYSGKDAFTLLNIYFATALMSIIMYMANDAKGIRLLKDKSNHKLTSWDKDMSPLNFWGYPIWRASAPSVKKLIGLKNSQAIFKVTRHVSPAQWRYLHLDLSFGKDAPIEWKDHQKTLQQLQLFDGMNVDRINILMNGVFKYDTSTHDQQVKVITKLFYYVQQFIPTSPLFLRLKAIQDALLLNITEESNVMAQEMKLLTAVTVLIEDEEAQDAEQGTSQGSPVSIATRAADVAPSKDTVNVLRKRRIVKRRRNPNIKVIKFPRPKNDKEEDELAT